MNSPKLDVISIQALYDYKFSVFKILIKYIQFQFKHCTIISQEENELSEEDTHFNSSIVRL